MVHISLISTKNFAYLFIGLILIFFSACSPLQKAHFPETIDTNDKPISLQNKQLYYLNQLEVSATNQFPGARLNNFKALNDSTIIISISPENKPINDSPYYSFKLWTKQPKTVYLKFEYPPENNHRYFPKIKQNNGLWHPLDSSLISKKEAAVLLKLSLTKDTTWVSAQEVISFRDTQTWTKSLKANHLTIQNEIAGFSSLGKTIPVLNIFKGSPKNKKTIILLTRQHPPEVTGYMAFQQFLATLLKNTDTSYQFFNHYRVIAFPIVNPDGVDLGHWRHNANGIDLNRDWSSYNQPEIKSVVKYINKTTKKDHGKVVLGLDFHSTWHDVFYTNQDRKETTLPLFITNWFSALETNIPNYKVNEASANSKRPVSKGWFLNAHNATGITYEIGDETPRDRIDLIGEISALEMMKILIKAND
jgi:predicted deacylase